MAVRTKSIGNQEMVIAVVEKEIGKKRDYIAYMKRLKESYDKDNSRVAVDFSRYITKLEEDLEDCKRLLAHINEYAPGSAHESKEEAATGVFEGMVDE